LGDGSSSDVVGKALVIHASEDDLTSQPAGNSGARVACGVISKKE
jgi:Cu-Zn family superoxide dismutase